jgi:hypothetical protein
MCSSLTKDIKVTTTLSTFSLHNQKKGYYNKPNDIAKNILIQCFQVFLFPNLKENLHGITIVVHFCEARKVPLHLLPFTTLYLILKILHVEEESRFLLQPVIYTQICSPFHISVSWEEDPERHGFRATKFQREIITEGGI